jgi:predicted methyltransferase
LKHRLLTSAFIFFWLAMVAAQEIANEPRRESWQRVPDLFSAAGVHPGAMIADVGAGEGFLTVRLSPLVGQGGRVYAVDSDPEVIAGLRKRVADAGMKNVEVIVSAVDDPRLPAGALDGAIILNAYHEMVKGVVILRHIHDSLKPGATLAICEPAPDGPGQSRASQTEDHVIYPEIIADELRQAGFQVIDRQEAFAKNLGGTTFSLITGKRLF